MTCSGIVAYSSLYPPGDSGSVTSTIVVNLFGLARVHVMIPVILETYTWLISKMKSGRTDDWQLLKFPFNA